MHLPARATEMYCTWDLFQRMRPARGHLGEGREEASAIISISSNSELLSVNVETLPDDGRPGIAAGVAWVTAVVSFGVRTGCARCESRGRTEIENQR